MTSAVAADKYASFDTDSELVLEQLDDTEGDWPGCDTDSELDDTEGDSYCADTGTYCLSCWPGTVQNNESRIIIISFSFGWCGPRCVIDLSTSTDY